MSTQINKFKTLRNVLIATSAMTVLACSDSFAASTVHIRKVSNSGENLLTSSTKPLPTEQVGTMQFKSTAFSPSKDRIETINAKVSANKVEAIDNLTFRVAVVAPGFSHATITPKGAIEIIKQLEEPVAITTQSFKKVNGSYIGSPAQGGEVVYLAGGAVGPIGTQEHPADSVVFKKGEYKLHGSIYTKNIDIEEGAIFAALDPSIVLAFDKHSGKTGIFQQADHVLEGFVVTANLNEAAKALAQTHQDTLKKVSRANTAIAGGDVVSADPALQDPIPSSDSDREEDNSLLEGAPPADNHSASSSLSSNTPPSGGDDSPLASSSATPSTPPARDTSAATPPPTSAPLESLTPDEGLFDTISSHPSSGSPTRPSTPSLFEGKPVLGVMPSATAASAVSTPSVVLGGLLDQFNAVANDSSPAAAQPQLVNLSVQGGKVLVTLSADKGSLPSIFGPLNNDSAAGGPQRIMQEERKEDGNLIESFDQNRQLVGFGIAPSPISLSFQESGRKELARIIETKQYDDLTQDIVAAKLPVAQGVLIPIAPYN